MSESNSILVAGAGGSERLSSFAAQHSSIKFVDNLSEYIDELHSLDPSVLVLLGELDGQPVEELLKISVNQDVGGFKVVEKDLWDPQQILSFKNDFGVDAFLDKSNQSDLEKWIQAGLLEAQKTSERDGIFKKLKTQNQELESFTMDLENIVNERTQNTLSQKQEIESNVTQIRGVIRFVKELSAQVSIEDTLLLIRNDLKGFHKINQCIFAVEDYNFNRRLYFYRGGSVVEHVAQNSWPKIQMIRINSLEDQKYLADELSFPIGKTISVALSTSSQTRNVGQPTLYFEHSMNFEEIDQFVEYISFRLQAIGITVDRILLQNEVRNVSYVWERTFDSIEDPVAIINREFQVLRANQKYFAQFENSKAILDGPSGGNQVEISIRSNRASSGSVKVGEKSFEVHSYPIIDFSTNVVTAVVNHYIDVTEANELQSQLIQNEKMSAIGHLAGHIAHELNNPLTGIRSLSQLLVSEMKDDEQMQGDMVEIEKAAGRCQRIIKNLLEFSSDSTEEEYQKVKLTELVDKTLPFLKTAMGTFERDIQLTEENDIVNVDPQLMQQVIFNLVNNACQAMPDKGELNISVKNEKDNVELTIVDSGTGIAPDKLKQIFEPFYTTKEKGQGTGLGLSMCRKIVERFSGEIRVESELDRGSTFKVILPLAKGGPA